MTPRPARLACFGAVLLLGSLSPAPAATVIADLFAGLSGTPSSNSGILDLGTLSLTGSGNAIVGNLTGVVVADTVTLTLGVPSSTLSLANTGIGGSFTVYDVFAGTNLLANTSYALTFTTQYTGVSLLSGFSVAVGTGSAASPSILASASSGSVLSLGGGADTVTLNFTTGSTVGSGFLVKFDSGAAVGLANTIQISGASLSTVPEPPAWALAGLAAMAAGFFALARRHLPSL